MSVSKEGVGESVHQTSAAAGCRQPRPSSHQYTLPRGENQKKSPSHRGLPPRSTRACPAARGSRKKGQHARRMGQAGQAAHFLSASTSCASLLPSRSFSVLQICCLLMSLATASPPFLDDPNERKRMSEGRFCRCARSLGTSAGDTEEDREGLASSGTWVGSGVCVLLRVRPSPEWCFLKPRNQLPRLLRGPPMSSLATIGMRPRSSDTLLPRRGGVSIGGSVPGRGENTKSRGVFSTGGGTLPLRGDTLNPSVGNGLLSCMGMAPCDLERIKRSRRSNSAFFVSAS
mmetsp:Transcript_10059/g.25137  ORF Transcript_10059/g.25137 Transcript_10059/m.25137 type:complete len:287 (-) Transcript_10059:187-1047(-)